MNHSCFVVICLAVIRACNDEENKPFDSCDRMNRGQSNKIR